jgi:hypothetical protein
MATNGLVEKLEPYGWTYYAGLLPESSAAGFHRSNHALAQTDVQITYWNDTSQAIARGLPGWLAADAVK